MMDADTWARAAVPIAVETKTVASSSFFKCTLQKKGIRESLERTISLFLRGICATPNGTPAMGCGHTQPLLGWVTGGLTLLGGPRTGKIAGSYQCVGETCASMTIFKILPGAAS